MANFSLSDEQKKLQTKAREFAREEMAPVAVDYDRSGEFPLEVFQKAYDGSLMNVQIPKELGGQGMGLFDACMLVEELAAGCPGMATSMEVNALATEPIMIGGNDAQKAKYFKRLTGKLNFAAFCCSEPSAGSDVAGIKTEARRDGDQYIINGNKYWITNGRYADFYSVFAYTDRSLKHNGMSGFIVDRDTEGIAIGEDIDKMGQRASNTCGVFFKDARVPAENLLGREGDGFKLAMNSFNHTRPAVAALAVGIARAAMERSVAYAKRRVAFGQPIAMYQAIQFMIADMIMNIEAARALVWKAAWMADSGLDNRVLASCAKAFAADMAMKVTTDAVQVHGGFGYTRNSGVEKLMRDAKLIQIYEGTSQIQRMLLAKGAFLGDYLREY